MVRSKRYLLHVAPSVAEETDTRRDTVYYALCALLEEIPRVPGGWEELNV